MLSNPITIGLANSEKTRKYGGDYIIQFYLWYNRFGQHLIWIQDLRTIPVRILVLDRISHASPEYTMGIEIVNILCTNYWRQKRGK